MLKLSTVIFIYTAALFNCYAIDDYVSHQGREYVNSIAAHASDVDGDTLSFSKVSGPDWLTVKADGRLSGTPQLEDVGVNSFVVKVTDSQGAFSTTTLIIAVDAAPVVETPDEPVNQAPTFSSQNLSLEYATENQAYRVSIALMASDPENDILTFSKVSGPDWLTVASNGDISGTPAASDVGAQTFIVQVTADGGEDSATINLTVKAKVVQQGDTTDTSSGGALYQLCLLLLAICLYRRNAGLLFSKFLSSRLMLSRSLLSRSMLSK